MKEIQLVIFDVDGLLLDTEAVWKQSYETIGSQYHIDNLHTEVFEAMVGRNGQEALDTFYAMVKHPQKEAILEACEALGYDLLERHIDVKPGAIELLDYLKEKKIECVVATSTNRELTLQRLARVGLDGYFSMYTCGDEVTLRKPDPEIYLKALMKAQGDKDTTLVLEDSHAGVLAASRANLPVIMVPDLIPPTKTQEDQCLAILDNLFEVKRYVSLCFE